MTETKTPQAGEFWISPSGRIKFIIGNKTCGSTVYEDSYGGCVSTHNWYGWHHEPRCTGFDWKEPTAIDLGEGWGHLPMDAVVQDGDEYEGSDGKWIRTQAAGSHVPSERAYRRKIQPAVVWPKWYVPRDRNCKVVVCKTSRVSAILYDGKDCAVTLPISIDDHHWKEVTEAEAMERLKPPAEETTGCPVVTADTDSKMSVMEMAQGIWYVLKFSSRI